MNQIILDFGALGLLGIAGYTVSVLAPIIVTAILTPVPGDEVVTIAFLMLSIAVTALSLGTILAFLQDHFNELVCAMLDGSNVSSSIVEFGETVDSLMAEDPVISPFGPVAVNYASSLVKAFATIDSFNRLYDKQPVEYPEAECICADPGVLLKTAITEPYNVMLVGDDVDQPGDASRGWYVDLTHNFTFTPQVNTANIRVRFTWFTSAPAGFAVGVVNLPFTAINLNSDGSGLVQEFDQEYAAVLLDDTQYSIVAHGQGGNGFEFRKILLESV